MKILTGKSILLICGLLASLAGQTQVPTGPLAVGDTLPDIGFQQTSNFPEGVTRLSQLKGKWVILDFWTTLCSSCLEDFRRYAGFKDQLKDKVFILTAIETPKDSILATYESLSKGKESSIFRMPSLPTITGDTLFTRFFPHSVVPHVIWIDPDRVVRQITSDVYVNPQDISALLNDRKLPWRQKKDLLAHDPDQAFFPQIGMLSPGVVKFYSAVARHIPGTIGATLRIAADSNAGTVRVTRLSYSISELYRDAFSRGMISDTKNLLQTAQFSYGKQVLLHIEDSSRFLYDPSYGITEEEWRQDNTYDYEGVFPLEEKDSVFSYMVNDLNRYFRLDGRLEYRKKHCLALVRTSSRMRLADTANFSREEDAAQYTYRLPGFPMGFLIDRLAQTYKDRIVVDHTGFKGGEVFIEGKAPLANLSALRKELRQKYDLDLVEMDLPVPVVVISDKKPSPGGQGGGQMARQ